MSTLFFESKREKTHGPQTCSFLLNKTLMIMKKTLLDFGKSLEIQIPDEQLIAIKGGRRRRRGSGGSNNDEDNGDPGCPPDYEE